MYKPGEAIAKGARPSRRALLLCCLLCTGLAAPVQAERADGRREASRQHQGQRDAGAARAAAIAQARYGGKVLKVSPQGGGSVYNVRLLLPDGTVKSVTVNAGD